MNHPAANLSLTAKQIGRGAWDIDTSPPAGEGHGGGDMQLMADFCASVRRGGNPTDVLAAAEEALQSHLLAFTAEEARLEKKVIELPRSGG
mgnify:FL=1